MTTLQEAAMRKALEALESIGIDFVCRAAHHSKKDQHSALAECHVTARHMEAIESLRAALAQQGEQPVAWLHTKTNQAFTNEPPPGLKAQCQPLYAVQRCTYCDEYAIDKWNLYKGRTPYDGTEDGRASPYTEGCSDGATNCVEAIQELKKAGK